MIEQALVFAFGFLAAGLVWLLFLPAFWRRALRLSRARIEQVLPLSLNEIEAEKDRLRAEHGVGIARLERALDEASARLACAREETGERIKAEAALIETLEQERRRIAELQSELGAQRVELQARDLQIADGREARRLAEASIASLEAQRMSLVEKLDAAVEVAEARRRQLDEVRVLAERSREALDMESRRNAELRSELQTLRAELRDAERQIEDRDNQAVLAKIRGGEETYQSIVPMQDRRQAG
ncbi:MAG TPA: hypothetical protein PKW21_16115 [Rhabdaerophilum sp.]|nr:hypothetical protein [Rhabdaerophilum sp.]